MKLFAWKAKKREIERACVQANARTEGDRNGHDNGDAKEINEVNWFLNGQTIYSMGPHGKRSICQFLWTKIDSLRFVFFFAFSLILCSMAACSLLLLSSHLFVPFFYTIFCAANEHRPLMTFEMKRMENEAQN